jgi:hypothetical protein
MEENEIIKDIQKEAETTLHETMWGGFANDILTGLQKNPGIQPDRPLWELVQNARDVSLEGGKAKIEFVRNQDSFIFKHNGQPFNRSTLQSLILQTSSKVRQDIIQVGQYGTGFLTTHKFGLDFSLTGSLSLLDGLKYYNFSGNDFVIKRSSQDKKELSDVFGKTIDTTQQWDSNPESWDNEPRQDTIFEYIHNYDVERRSAKIAIDEAPQLVPVVLSLQHKRNSDI